MKSIKIFFTAFILLIAISSCDKLKEATLVKTTVNFNIDVPLESSPAASIVNSTSLKSAELVNSFSGYADFNLSEEPDLSNFINGIQQFNITSTIGELEGLVEGNEILSATITILNKVTAVQLFSFTLPSKLSYSIKSFSIDQLDALSTVMLENKNITLKVLVSGTSNFPLVKGQHTLKTTIDGNVYYTPL
jgi:hypothetical protein